MTPWILKSETDFRGGGKGEEYKSEEVGEFH